MDTVGLDFQVEENRKLCRDSFCRGARGGHGEHEVEKLVEARGHEKEEGQTGLAFMADG